MEIFTLLLLVFIIILLLKHSNTTNEKLSEIQRSIARMKEQIKDLHVTPPASTPVTSTPPPPPKTVAPKPVIPPPVEEQPAAITPQPDTYWQSGFTVNKKPDIAETPAPAPKPQPVQEPQPGFFERHPDLEKFIGENLVSKIGIAILVLAIGFFVKYAIDNEWIGPVGRVAVGLVAGGILVGIAHHLRNSYKAFSSVLIGGGMVVFYFTIALAYHQFQLLPQTAAFISMIVITAFAVLLALLYNRQELAIISMLGGFATPFLLSNGSGNYHALLIYLIILNTGLLIVAYNRAWRLLNVLAFICTTLIYAAWLATAADGVAQHRYAFIYSTVFYLLFFSINIAHNIKSGKAFVASDFGILLANTCLYFTGGLYCLYQMDAASYKGLFAAGMGVFNLAASYALFRNKKIDTNVLYLLIGITLTFVSITAPLQLHGSYITLFWSSEAVLLYWLYTKSNISLIRLASLAVWACMLISLLLDWKNVYADAGIYLPVFINKGFTTTLYSAITSLVLSRLLFKNKEDAFYTMVVGVAGIVLLYMTGLLEIMHQVKHHLPASYIYVLYMLLYTMVFILLCVQLLTKMVWLQFTQTAGIILRAAAVLIFLFCLPTSAAVQAHMLQSAQGQIHFIAHWLSAIGAAICMYQLIQQARRHNSIQDNPLLSWIFCIAILIYLTTEVQFICNTLFYNQNISLERIQQVYVKTGWPILWALASFAFMWLGMQHKYRPLRIISLTVFTVTLLKLFLYDISNIPMAGKIAAFFCLGVILLIVSFMYQRLKKIIAEDDKPQQS